MTPIYNDELHIRARNNMRAAYDSTRSSFKYYSKQFKLTDDAIKQRFGDVWNDLVLMQNACDVMKKEKAMKRRRQRNVRALVQEIDRLDRLIEAKAPQENIKEELSQFNKKATPSMKKYLQEVNNEIVAALDDEEFDDYSEKLI
jgi:hypothetical protein